MGPLRRGRFKTGILSSGNDTSVFRLRIDPEYYVTAQGPFNYNRLVRETETTPALNDGLWRVDLGLGPLRP